MDTKVILIFADAIQKKRMMHVTFVTKDARQLVRKCAPLDLAPSSRAKIKFYKFHFWDFESVPKPHVLSLSPDQIVKLEVLDEHFEPKSFMTWSSTWTIARNWDDQT